MFQPHGSLYQLEECKYKHIMKMTLQFVRTTRDNGLGDMEALGERRED
jgi:hypothetical protein